MITVGWRDAEECYIVEQDDKFIHDNESLHGALTFALAVAVHAFENVNVIDIKPEEK